MMCDAGVYEIVETKHNIVVPKSMFRRFGCLGYEESCRKCQTVIPIGDSAWQRQTKPKYMICDPCWNEAAIAVHTGRSS